MREPKEELPHVWPAIWPETYYELEKRISKLEWQAAKTDGYAREAYDWMKDVKAGDTVKLQFSSSQRWFLTFGLSIMSLVTATVTAILLKVLE